MPTKPGDLPPGERSDMKILRRLARVSVYATVGFLMFPFAGWAQEEPGGQTPSSGFGKTDPRATMSRQLRVPRNPDNGLGVGEHVLSINGDSFGPFDTTTTYSYKYLGTAYVRYATGATGGQTHAYFSASFDLPSGAVLDEVQMEVHAGSATSNMGFYVEVCDGTVALAGCGSIGGAFSSGAPGATYLDLAGLSATIDDLHKSYFIELDAGDDFSGANAWRRALVFYHLQVSPAPGTADFGDVPTSSPQFQFVEALFHAGITSGCGGGNYCPNNPVTRGQMAVFLSKALGLWFPN